MVGFYARADAAQPIRLDLDNELMGTSTALFPLLFSPNRLAVRSLTPPPAQTPDGTPAPKSSKS